MQVRLEKTFPVQAPAAAAWELMRDVRRLSECLPGARITEQLDERHYHGLVNVKIGPIAAAFKGKIEVQNIDPERRELRLFGTGMDTSGASTASMQLSACVRDSGNGGCELIGVSEVRVTGRIASFGGRMLNQISGEILNQFADNFRSRIAQSGAGAPGHGGAPARELNAVALFLRALWNSIKGLLPRGSGRS